MKPFRLKALGFALASIPMGAVANPQGSQVVAGSVSVAQESPTKVGITQTSDKAIINWDSFSIRPGEHTQFYQPSASAVILNRVVGGNPSEILGRMSANGRVFLVNPNGIYFGKDSQIDVAGLVASTHDIRDGDFLAGRYNFTIPGKPGAAVINEGTIRIADTGIAAFVAPSVANRGLITARLGKVSLAAANGFTLDFTGDKLLTFLVGDDVAQTAFDLEGNRLTSFVENAGRIEAQGGFVLLTAKAAENAVHGVINHSGVVEATTVDRHKGEIILHAGKGSLEVSGTLDASAANGGDGGFIETSGGNVSIAPATKITTVAPYGRTGRWLIDPTDYTIAATNGDITGAALAGYLALSNVEIQTLTTGTGNGDIFVNDTVTWNTLNKLTLTAYRHINVNAAINANGGGSLKLRADSEGRGTGTVTFSGSGHVTANGGAVGIYYNPLSYTNVGTKSDVSGNPYTGFVTLSAGSALTSYMLVNNVNQLQDINQNLTGHYALGKNIDASNYAFDPLGSFSGKLYGQSYKINSLSISKPNEAFVGLFSNLNGYVYDLYIDSASIVGSQSVGVISGANWGTIEKVHVENSSIQGQQKVGGVAGENYGTISRTAFSGNIVARPPVSGAEIGGIAGVNGSSGLITHTLSVGSISTIDTSRVNNVQDGPIGGLLGLNYGQVSASASFMTIYSNPSFYWVGSLVGANSTNPPLFQVGVMTNAYWKAGLNSGLGGAGLNSGQLIGSFGLSEENSKRQLIYIGFDFNDIWTIQEGVSYPTLRRTSELATTVLRPGTQDSGGTDGGDTKRCQPVTTCGGSGSGSSGGGGTDVFIKFMTEHKDLYDLTTKVLGILEPAGELTPSHLREMTIQSLDDLLAKLQDNFRAAKAFGASDDLIQEFRHEIAVVAGTKGGNVKALNALLENPTLLDRAGAALGFAARWVDKAATVLDLALLIDKAARGRVPISDVESAITGTGIPSLFTLLPKASAAGAVLGPMMTGAAALTLGTKIGEVVAGKDVTSLITDAVDRTKRQLKQVDDLADVAMGLGQSGKSWNEVRESLWQAYQFATDPRAMVNEITTMETVSARIAIAASGNVFEADFAKKAILDSIHYVTAISFDEIQARFEFGQMVQSSSALLGR